jgi:hypothetical protein
LAGVAIRVGAVVIGFVALTAVGSSPAAVQVPQQQPPIFRAGANIVRVDVTVTNRRGEPVTDLTRDDFFVTEDGAPRTSQLRPSTQRQRSSEISVTGGRRFSS